MTDSPSADRGWFAGLGSDDAVQSVRDGTAPQPKNWPKLAIEDGFAPNETGYYARLREATIAAARAEVEEAESADDRQLIHAVRAMDDCERTANELAERVADWAPTVFDEDGAGLSYARTVSEIGPETPAEERVVSLAERAIGLDDERRELRAFVERRTRSVAPNLAALAGPILAARLIALAGGLKPLARKPSGTVQVLGAEDALFAHLRGHAPSPKHGLIYTHEAVRTAPAGHRGSAARALAGKLSIAARIDHYAGDRRPELDEELADRMAQIHAREAER